MRTIRRACDDLRRGGDEGIAMLSAIMLALILTTLSILVLGLVLSQAMPTQFQRKSTQTVYAAEAGIETALSSVRTALGSEDFVGAVYGDIRKLPCALEGTVATPGGDLGYKVTVRYYRDNPAGQSESWLNSKKLSCVPGSGTTLQPLFAYITSTGDAPTGATLGQDDAVRTMSSIYRFNTTSTNVVGGRLYSYESKYCLRADGTTAGSTVSYVRVDQCGVDDDRELWVYDKDYQIKLAITTLPGSGPPLCITGPSTNTSSLTLAYLRECAAATSSSRWNQLWSWEAGARFKGENTAITNYGAFCLRSSGTPLNSKLYTGSCSDKQDWGSFNPDPAVGAGAAGPSTNQIVNFLEFGRCFDVTRLDVNFEHMIIYPCKQDPSGGSNLEWNHKWYYSEPTGGATTVETQIVVRVNNSTAPSNTYCLTASATTLYPKLTRCSDSAQNQRWIRSGDTGNYQTSFTFMPKGMQTKCIGLGDGFEEANWSKMVLADCNGGIDQKWNAPPEKVSASVGNYLESRGG
ncbi:hypothetical protein [Cellulomonas iranensis]|uniref:Ricin B lectin domain-containing protein n=1 Tax=Cellulomonas iranensis TaxID=76862 RepID=A0ABU0GNY1_9CELL|nr:hypothetical protein [Cellulomonas iranensis]MDQ0427068.1 hypothetical protein [Cellulomonas iranensis]